MTNKNDDTIKVTMFENGVPVGYNLSYNKYNIYLNRVINIEPFKRTTSITLTRQGLTSVRFDEGPDLRTASFIGICSGLSFGIGGTIIGYSLTSQNSVGALVGFGGFFTGFLGGFSLSMNRFRITTLQLRNGYEKYKFWTTTNNVDKLQDLITNINGIN